MITYYPYQEQGIQFALERTHVLIADEMGLGKTVQAIGVLNNLSISAKVLIVCPASLKMNWANELNEWLSAAGRMHWLQHGNITVTNYEQLSKIDDQPWNVVIGDEAHYIKNREAKRTLEFQRIAKNAKRVILLTGTPILNKPVELWPLLQVLDPESWGTKTRDFFTFAKRYCNAHQEPLGKRSPWGRRVVWVFDGASNLDELQERLRSTIMVRRLKTEVLTQLPDKQYEVVVFPASPGVSLPSYLQDCTELNYEAVIRKLRGDKVLFEEYSKKRHEQGLAKIDFVCNHVTNVLETGQKVILFGYHTDVIAQYAEKLKSHMIITGETPIEKRQELVDSFQRDEGERLIIGSVGAMGTGFTLTAASVVMFGEVDPVPGNNAQAIDRAHRIGQKNAVLAQYLVQDRSIDAKICKILIQKQKVIAQTLNCRHVKTLAVGDEQKCESCGVVLR